MGDIQQDMFALPPPAIGSSAWTICSILPGTGTLANSVSFLRLKMFSRGGKQLIKMIIEEM